MAIATDLFESGWMLFETQLGAVSSVPENAGGCAVYVRENYSVVGIYTGSDKEHGKEAHRLVVRAHRHGVACDD